jgi:hypothetical protein
MSGVRIVGIDPGLRVTGFSFGRGLHPLNRRCRLACAEADHPRLMRRLV